MLNAKLKAVAFTDEERSARRFRLLLPASAETAEAGLVDVSLHDLSATGFLIECAEPLSVGSEISLELPGIGSATGDVVWASGRFIGGEFRKALPPSALSTARASSPVLWPDFTPTSAAHRGAEAVAEQEAEVPLVAEPAIADTRLPVARRVQVIVGASILLWTPLAFGLWSALG